LRIAGSATNVLWLNKQGAINNAENSANQNLENYLKNAVREYSCPDCGFYQTEMIRRMKNNIWQKGIVFGVLAFVVVIALTSSSSAPLLYALVSGLAVGFISLGKLINFDPNSDAQARKNKKFSETYPVLRKSNEVLRANKLIDKDVDSIDLNSNLDNKKIELKPKSLDEMSESEKYQFATEKLLPAMKEVAIENLTEREAAKKEAMAYVNKAIKERDRKATMQRAFFMLIALIIVVLIFVFSK
jgi:hypothetical protein